jgi:hypothetical protein
MDVSGIEGQLKVILHQQREKGLYNLILERILFCRMDDVGDSHLVKIRTSGGLFKHDNEP